MATDKAVPKGYSHVKEGQATILQQGNSVFYNKAQVVNRDLSIAVLQWFIEQRRKEGGKQTRHHRPKIPSDTPLKEGVGGIAVLEALAATGLRAIRYAREIEGVGQVVANDMDTGAVASMRRNVDFNDAGGKVTPHESDARVTMLTHQQGFHVVDLDPYGSPNTLLDAGVQCVAENGLLCVTATDMAVLCGNTAEACYAKYGSYSLHKDYCHEQALRILLASISQHAARHKRVVEPVLCMAIDFYVRLFVRVRTSPAEVKHTAERLSYLWQSTGCASWWLQPVGTVSAEKPPRFQPGRGPVVPDKCPISGGRFAMGGPIWHGPLHDMAAVKQIYAHIELRKAAYPAQAKLLGLLRAVQEELSDVPLYYTTAGLCRTLRCLNPKADHLHGAISSAGYRASATHCNKDGLKTDAPPEVIWDIMRCWVKQHPVSEGKQDSHSKHILSQEPKLQAVFSRSKGAFSRAKADKVARFVTNPENWGPRPRHGRPLLAHEEHEQACQARAETQHAGALPSADTHVAALPLTPSTAIVAGTDEASKTKRQKIA